MRLLLTIAAFFFILVSAAAAQQVTCPRGGHWCGPGRGCCPPGNRCAPNYGCIGPPNTGVLCGPGRCREGFHCINDNGVPRCQEN